MHNRNAKYENLGVFFKKKIADFCEYFGFFEIFDGGNPLEKSAKILKNP